MNKPKLIFYDFEVYSRSINPDTGECFWMVVMIDYDTKKKAVIINDREKLQTAYDLLKNDIFIGYNSRQYDQHIFKGLLLGMNAGFINDKLIIEGKKGYEVVRGGNKIPFNNFDISTGFHSLKQLEAFLGSRIKEASVPFDIDRPLTEGEINEITEYCTHDVEQTILVFEAKREEFDSQLALIEAFSLGMDNFNKTKAQLAAHILGAEKQPNRGDEFEISFPECLRIEKYKHVLDWYKNPENLDYKNKLKTEVAGQTAVMGFGGYHSCLPNYHEEDAIILCADVASLYPSIIVNFNYMSRNVDGVTKYKEIIDERLRLKALKDPRQQPYKIVINSAFGAKKDQYNALYDPLMSNNICVTGMMLLLDLIEKVEPYCIISNANTDGIFMTVKDRETVNKIKEVAAEWENRTNLILEWEEFSKIHQKDVNSYIIIDDKGNYKSKGSYLKKLNDLDYDLPIVNQSLINYFTKAIPVEQTINDCNKLREFQKVVKVSRLYITAMHGEIKLTERVLRVFADNRPEAQGVFKLKRKINKEGIEVEVAEKIGNTPDRCFIDNDDVKNKFIPEYLDKQYYIDLAQERLNAFLGIPKKKKSKKKKGEEV